MLSSTAICRHHLEKDILLLQCRHLALFLDLSLALPYSYDEYETDN